MKDQEIHDLIKNNDSEKISFYLTTLLGKCKDIERENNFIALFMIILILVFYSTNFTQLDGLQIGPFSIKDINSVKIFIPLVFSFLIFRFLVISSHKAEIEKIIKIISRDYFKHKSENIDTTLHLDDFTRTILPISNYAEINNLTLKGKSKFGCFGAIIIFPLTFIALIPYTLEFIWLKDFLFQFDNFNFFEKSSIILSIWLTILSIYYFIHKLIINMKENK